MQEGNILADYRDEKQSELKSRQSLATDLPLPNLHSRIPHINAKSFGIFGDDAAGGDDGVGFDGDAGEDGGAGADPDQPFL